MSVKVSVRRSTFYCLYTPYTVNPKFCCLSEIMFSSPRKNITFLTRHATKTGYYQQLINVSNVAGRCKCFMHRCTFTEEVSVCELDRNKAAIAFLPSASTLLFFFLLPQSTCSQFVWLLDFPQLHVF